MQILRIENKQRAKRVNTGFLTRVLRDVLEELLKLRDYQAAIHLVSAKKMAELNENYLNHEGSTDVITFDYRSGYEEDEKGGESKAELNGEIFISMDDAVLQAREFKTHWQQEVIRYSVHGFLHLLGYDDLGSAKRREMKRRENALMKQVEKKFNLRQIGK